MHKHQLYLASQSPRRKELLGHLNIPFKILPAHLDEVSHYSDPIEKAHDLAMQKARAVMEKLQLEKNFGQDFFPIVVASDTMVLLDNEILNKPDDRDDAARMLMKLSGRSHRVVTGVALIGLFPENSRKLKQHSFAILSQVHFDPITPELLADYLATGDPLDKAGAYGIQGPALTFIGKIEGSYSNIVGLPLNDLTRELKLFVGRNDANWREVFE